MRWCKPSQMLLKSGGTLSKISSFNKVKILPSIPSGNSWLSQVGLQVSFVFAGVPVHCPPDKPLCSYPKTNWDRAGPHQPHLRPTQSTKTLPQLFLHSFGQIPAQSSTAFPQHCSPRAQCSTPESKVRSTQNWRNLRMLPSHYTQSARRHTRAAGEAGNQHHAEGNTRFVPKSNDANKDLSPLAKLT